MLIWESSSPCSPNVYFLSIINSWQDSSCSSIPPSSINSQLEDQTSKPEKTDTDEPQVKDEIPDESSGDNTAEINTLITTPNE